MSEFDHKIEVTSGSDRSFGFVFFAVFALVGLVPLFSDGSVRWWSLVVASAFLALSLAAPQLLRTPNRWWFKFGTLLGAIVAPVVLALVYVIAIIPTGIIVRLLGKDPLNRKIDKLAGSYWVERTGKMHPMKNQF